MTKIIFQNFSKLLYQIQSICMVSEWAKEIQIMHTNQAHQSIHKNESFYLYGFCSAVVYVKLWKNL